jgi:hypothetical protein
MKLLLNIKGIKKKHCGDCFLSGSAPHIISSGFCCVWDKELLWDINDFVRCRQCLNAEKKAAPQSAAQIGMKI